MSTLSLGQLVTPMTNEQTLELVLEILESLKFPARSWQVGSTQRTLIETFSRVYASETGAVSTIASSGYNEDAEGDNLELFSLSHYNNAKKPATPTRGHFRLAADANAPGPFSLAVGDMVIADATSGQTFRNVASGTLLLGGTLDLLMEAEQPGAAGDIPPTSTLIMRTPLAGVTATNPITPGQTSWITQNGGDAESNEALRARNRSKWATLGAVGNPGMAYAYYAATAHPSVRRVHVDDQNPFGPGTIGVYLAGDGGAVSSVVVDAVTDYLRGDIDGKKKIATGALVGFFSAVPRGVTIKATVYLASSYNTPATQADILARVRAYFKDLPVGGAKNTLDDPGVVVFGELYKAVLTVPGVRNAVWTTPLGDVPLLPSEVAIPVLQLRYVGV